MLFCSKDYQPPVVGFQVLVKWCIAVHHKRFWKLTTDCFFSDRLQHSSDC